MEVGGVILGSGMVLDLAESDYDGERRIEFMVCQILGVKSVGGRDWVVLDGRERPSATASWRVRQVQVKVASLKKSLTLL